MKNYFVYVIALWIVLGITSCEKESVIDETFTETKLIDKDDSGPVDEDEIDPEDELPPL